jgi:hypothetical protein
MCKKTLYGWMEIVENHSLRSTHSHWLVVVAVDGEDGELNVDIGILVIDSASNAMDREGRVRHDLKTNRSVAKAMRAKQRHAAMHCAA